VGIGEEEHYQGVYYKGNVEVNLAGKWDKGFNEPMWVISSLNLKPSRALVVYGLRMKIEECFRDFKSRFHWCQYKVKTNTRREMLTFCLMVSYTMVALLGYQVQKTNRASTVSSYGKSSIIWLGIGVINHKKVSTCDLFRQIRCRLDRITYKIAA